MGCYVDFVAAYSEDIKKIVLGNYDEFLNQADLSHLDRNKVLELFEYIENEVDRDFVSPRDLRFIYGLELKPATQEDFDQLRNIVEERCKSGKKGIYLLKYREERWRPPSTPAL